MSWNRRGQFKVPHRPDTPRTGPLPRETRHYTWGEVTGYRVGSFLVASNKYGSVAYWTVTHVPTGGLMHRGAFGRRQDAVAFARAVEPLADWETATAETVWPRELGHRVMEVAKPLLLPPSIFP